MSADDCLSADWLSIGKTDGSRGYEESRFDSRASACTKHGVTADFTAYQNGYNSGIRNFCVASNGYNVGVNKKEYRNVCPADLKDPFLKEYIKGLNYAINDLDLDLRELDVEYRDAEVDLKKVTTEEEKESIEKRLKRIDSNINRMRSENEELREWLDTAINQL